MNQAVRISGGILALAFLGAAIYFGFNESWGAAAIFFLLFGGAEFTLYALGDNDKNDRRS
jgi:hypothetical protein